MYNKLLTNKDRKDFEPLIQDMFSLCPEMMNRKNKEANVQQAFIVRTVLDLLESFRKSILCIGCFEDTAFEYLKKLGVVITGIDPNINVDLHTFKQQTEDKFGIIFSTSVIEHVKDDELFVKDICELLDIDGTAILTCDFKAHWQEGQPIHPLDFRFYTEYDLNERLNNIIKQYGCCLISEPLWKGDPDFFYDGFAYNFATWVFRKVYIC